MNKVSLRLQDCVGSIEASDIPDDILKEIKDSIQDAAVKLDHAVEDLISINEIIFASGAPLGSDEYFGIREIAAKHLRKSKEEC